jgi:hypothetical protein
MCWNANISLNTFIFGCISAIIIYFFGIIEFKYIIITLSFTLIQLLEYFLWNNLNNIKINEFLSKIGLFIIGIQIFLLCYFYKNEYILYFYFIFVFLFILIELKNIKFKTIIGKNKHLRWLWLEPNIIWIIIFSSFYLITNIDNKHKFIFVLITLIISLYYYYEYRTWGSMWCYFSNILWIHLLIYSIIIYLGLNRFL